MRIEIITCLPELLEGPFSASIVKRAIDKKLANVNIHNLRDYASNKHKHVDDYPYGGGAGMVLMIEPIDRCIQDLKSKHRYDEVIYMSPDGQLLDQPLANKLAIKQNLIILCGHYKGVDERVREHLITKEISIGDYVLSGGEIAAAVVVDAIVRLLPGVLGNEMSALTDSFQDGLVAPPVYTRPAEFNTWKVPEVLMSGHAAKIDEWRHEKAVERTKNRRPGMIHGD